jgi:hypothetical protein
LNELQRGVIAGAKRIVFDQHRDHYRNKRGEVRRARPDDFGDSSGAERLDEQMRSAKRRRHECGH